MFKVSPLFSDHAILPADREIRIFGTADEGESIRAVLTRADGTVAGQGMAAVQEGRFLIRLPAQRLGVGPLTLTLTSDTLTWTASDLVTGYLFMAGGQSNMEWGLWNADGGREIIQTHDDPDLRYFNVPRVSVLDEAGIAAHDAARWQQIAPHSGGDMSAVAYFFAREIRAKTGVPVGVIGCNWGGTSILSWMDEETLNGCAPAKAALQAYESSIEGMTLEVWQERQAAFQAEMDAWNGAVARIKEANPGIEWAEVEKQAGVCPWHPPIGPGSPYRPGQLHRSMVESIVPAALSGILFYQGESDVERAEDYGELLISLVRSWRELFGDAELPFYNVQLPMYIDAGAKDDRRWGILRQQQEKAWRALENSYLAVMIDGGEYGNIHPVDKLTPGRRLAQLFLGADETPRAVSRTVCGKVLTVQLSAPVKTLHAEPELFEIAGEDGVYHPARAAVEGLQIHLTADAALHPVKARYAFVNWGKVAVFGENGLPLAPFAIDA